MQDDGQAMSPIKFLNMALNNFEKILGSEYMVSEILNTTKCLIGQKHFFYSPGAVARSEACLLGMQAARSSIPTSGAFFREDLVMKKFLRPFSLFRWFKKSSCQLLAKECAVSTGTLAQE